MERKRFYLDCEFIEDGKTIDLISIGIVDETGREYYAISTEYNPRKANQWVKDNVLNTLPERRVNFSDPATSPRIKEEALAWKSRKRVADDIIKFVYGDEPGSVIPEFWGEWCSYDWVAFCQLFGTMMDLPKGFPMRCRDIIQLAEDDMFIDASELPTSLETEGNHNALLGAKTVKMRHEWLIGKSIEKKS